MTALRQRMIEDMQLRNFSEQTQKLDLSSVERLAKHYHKSPEAITDEELRQCIVSEPVRQIGHEKQGRFSGRSNLA